MIKLFTGTEAGSMFGFSSLKNDGIDYDDSSLDTGTLSSSAKSSFDMEEFPDSDHLTIGIGQDNDFPRRAIS